MDKRSEKLKRLARIQNQIGKIAEMELTEAHAERRLTEERMGRLIEALASPLPVHYGFSRLYGGQLGRLKMKKQILDGKVRLIERRLLSERAKADSLAENAKQAAGEERREAEDDAVFDLLDYISNADSSLP